MINHLKKIQFTYFLRLVICHLWYRFSIDTEVLYSGIVPKPKVWYQAIPTSKLVILHLHSKLQVSSLREWVPWRSMFFSNLFFISVVQCLSLQRVHCTPENGSQTSHIHVCSLTHSSNVIMCTFKIDCWPAPLEFQQSSFVCVQTEVNYACTV